MLEINHNKHFLENIEAIKTLQEEGFSEKEIQELIKIQEEEDKKETISNEKLNGKTKEQYWWNMTYSALDRIFDRCEEIDPNNYNMLADIHLIRMFINKHKPQ